MTQTERNLQKHIRNIKEKDTALKMLESDMKATRSNLAAKAWVLSNKHRIPMQAQITVTEERYKLDFHKYKALCYIYAVIKYASEDERTTVLNKYPTDLLEDAVYEELYNTPRYKKIMDEVEHLLCEDEVLHYIQYFSLT